MNLFAVRTAVFAMATPALAIAPAGAQSKNYNLNVDFNDKTTGCADLHVDRKSVV